MTYRLSHEGNKAPDENHHDAGVAPSIPLPMDAQPSAFNGWEASTEDYARIFRHTHVALVMLGRRRGSFIEEHIILRANPAFARMIGVKLTDIVGTEFSDLFPPEGKWELRERIESLSNPDIDAPFEAELRNASGEYLPVLLHSSNNPDGHHMERLMAVYPLSREEDALKRLARVHKRYLRHMIEVQRRTQKHLEMASWLLGEFSTLKEAATILNDPTTADLIRLDFHLLTTGYHMLLGNDLMYRREIPPSDSVETPNEIPIRSTKSVCSHFSNR
jgi:PAS domain S-box-containing protein